MRIFLVIHYDSPNNIEYSPSFAEETDSKISMDLLICNSEDKISLFEIVQAVFCAYESKAFAEILKLILDLI